MEQVLRIWPTVKALADDLGVKYTTVHSWVRRGRIPAAYDLALLRASRARGHVLTLEQLALLRMDGAATYIPPGAGRGERGAA